MHDVTCARCGETRQGLEKPPLPATVGQQIFEATCSVCWREWMAAQTILMNEKSLTPVNPEHYSLIVVELRKFLVLQEKEDRS